MLSRYFLLAAAAFAIGGCAATSAGPGAAGTAAQADAVVYVYREDGHGLGSRGAYFFVDDVNVFDLDRHGYSWVALPPGRYTLRQKWPVDTYAKPTQVEIELKPGEQRFFAFDTGLCGENGPKTICVRYEFQEQSTNAGRAAIAGMKFQENFGAARLRQRLSPQ